jgi:hypothetical protein
MLRSRASMAISASSSVASFSCSTVGPTRNVTRYAAMA